MIEKSKKLFSKAANEKFIGNLTSSAFTYIHLRKIKRFYYKKNKGNLLEIYYKKIRPTLTLVPRALS